jgi:hypothetical protein
MNRHRLTSAIAPRGVEIWYEEDQDERVYTLAGAIAWKVLGRHVQRTERGPVLTGLVVAYMIGDYDPHVLDPADLRPISPLSYCPSTGQIIGPRQCP